VEPPEADPFTVMYAGAHGLANGLDTVLDAARRLSDGVAAPRFVFVGEGPLRDGLMQRAKREGIANVEFRPPVPKNCVHRTLADAHAFVLPLKRGKVFEHGISPNKLFDYMAAARPVILSVDTPNNPVAEARAGETVAPEDAEGLAAAVNRLQSMPASERRAMGARAREYVVAHHDLAALAPRLEAALSAVCGSCARQGGQALL
jgi:glycosyltransferase involved in cell wall biosynthesis